MKNMRIYRMGLILLLVLVPFLNSMGAPLQQADAAALSSNPLKVPISNASWKDVMKSNSYDPSNDQQSSDDSDLLGDATHPMVQAAKQDNVTVGGSSTTAYFYKVRIGTLGNGNTSTNFYLAIDLDGNVETPVPDVFVEASVSSANGTYRVALHKADPAKTGLSPSSTGWLNSSTNTAIEEELFSQTKANYTGDHGFIESVVSGTNYVLPSAAEDLDADGKTDKYINFALTFASLKAFAARAFPTKYANLQQSNTVVLFAFTSTSQTSNGDLGGVNDGTADLTKSWTELGVTINSTLDDFASGNPSKPTVTEQVTKDTTPTVCGTAILMSGDLLEAVLNGVTYSKSLDGNDTNDTITLTLLNADTYTWCFTVSSALAENTYEVVAKTTRAGVTVTDVTTNELTITGATVVQSVAITSSAGTDLTYGVSDVIEVSVTFSAAVTVTGTPRIYVDIGGVSTPFSYTSGSGTTTLKFNYTVVSGDHDLNGVSVNEDSLELNGGVISESGTNANLSHSSLVDDSNHKVDAKKPEVTITMTDSELIAGETSDVTFCFSESVTGFTLSDVTVQSGTFGSLGSPTLNGDGTECYTATFTPTASTTDLTNKITVQADGYADSQGNTGNSGTSLNYSVDVVTPDVTITMTDGQLSSGETTDVTFCFSESVSGFTLDDVSADNGTFGTLSAPTLNADGTECYTATFTPSASVTDLTNEIRVTSGSYTDQQGNTGQAGSSSNYTIDVVKPEVTITMSDDLLLSGETSDVTFCFSEAVTGFTLDDVTADNGTFGTLSSPTLNADGTECYTATFTPTANSTDLTNQIAVNADGYADSQGNLGNSGTSSNYSMDVVSPEVSITMNDAELIEGDTMDVTFCFSESITGFTLDDVTADNGTFGTLSAPTLNADGTECYTATFTPTSSTTDMTNLIVVGEGTYSDQQGNTGSSGSSQNYSIDLVKPEVTITMTDTQLLASETSEVTFCFSEEVTGFTLDDVTVENGTFGTLSAATLNEDGTECYSALFTPTTTMTDLTNEISVSSGGYADKQGNLGGSGTSSNYTIDGEVPEVTITMSDSELTIGETSEVTFCFSEAVDGFTIDDVTVENGTFGTLSDPTLNEDGTECYTATFTPSADISDLTNLISIDANLYADKQGNLGNSANSSNFTIDVTKPEVTITMSDSELTVGETSEVTFCFSEDVIGFTLDDVTADNGTFGSLSEPTLNVDGTECYTATFTPTSDFTGLTNEIKVSEDSYEDAQGNLGSSGVSLNYSIDGEVPTVTIELSDDLLLYGETSDITFCFSEEVDGFTIEDVTVENGTLGTLSAATVNEDGSECYTATFTPSSCITDVTNEISIDANLYADNQGNLGEGATSGNYAIDLVKPELTISMTDTELVIGETAEVEFCFSEAVDGFTIDDVTVENGSFGSLSDPTLNEDGTECYTVTFTPSADITDLTNQISMDANLYSDKQGNLGSSANSSNYEILVDIVNPDVTITLSDYVLLADETSEVSFCFSEEVTGFTLDDITVDNGSLGILSDPTLNEDGTQCYTATFTPTPDITDLLNDISISADSYEDKAGNSGGAGTSFTYAIDGEVPTVTITIADDELIYGQTTTVTFCFSEEVEGFTLTDVTKANGTFGTLGAPTNEEDGTSCYAVTFTPTANVTDLTNEFTVVANGYEDNQGNLGDGATSSNYRIDVVKPTVNIIMSDSSLSFGDTSVVTFCFSEDVSGFTLADVTVQSGTFGTLSEPTLNEDGTECYTVTFTPTANVTDLTNQIAVSVGSYTDQLGNTGTSGTSANYVVDVVKPTVLITLSDSALTIGEIAVVTFCFSEEVTGFTLSDATAPSGTLSSLSSGTTRGDGTQCYTATFTPTPDLSDATNVMTVGANLYTDRRSNAGNSGTSANYTVNTINIFNETPPVFGPLDMVDALDNGPSMRDEVTSNGLPVLKFQGPTGVAIVLVGASGTTLTNNAHYRYTYTNGTYTLTLVDAVPGGTVQPFGTYSFYGKTNNPAATADGTYTVRATYGANQSVEIGRFAIQTAMLAIKKGTHTRYLRGYPDGTFRPEQSITRAEMAAVLANTQRKPVILPARIFIDVPTTHWANGSIRYAVQTGLMNGTTSVNFSPNQPITRAEFALLMAKLITPLNVENVTFSDVSKSNSLYSVITKVVSSGYMDPYPDNSFRPNKYITRAEVATTYNKVLNRGPLANVTKSRWKDVPLNHWAQADIEEASVNHEYEIRVDLKEYVTAYLN